MHSMPSMSPSLRLSTPAMMLPAGASLLLVFQLLSGTDEVFALLVFTFILLSGVTGTISSGVGGLVNALNNLI